MYCCVLSLQSPGHAVGGLLLCPLPGHMSGCGYHVLLCPLTAVSWACGGWVWLLSIVTVVPAYEWVWLVLCSPLLQSPGHAMGGCGYYPLLCPLPGHMSGCGYHVLLSPHCSLPGMRVVNVYDIDQKTYLIKWIVCSCHLRYAIYMYMYNS